jgi:hypothetical protein
VSREVPRGEGAAEAPVPWRTWLWDHIGRIAGTLLGLALVAAIALLAAAGFKPALVLLLVVVAGAGLVALGGRLRED